MPKLCSIAAGCGQDKETLQLMSHVGEKVEIKGTLIEQQEGNRAIKIESYQVVKP